MRNKLACYLIFTVLLVGCNNEEKINGVLVGQNLVHLSNGTPEPAKQYFQERIEEGDGGLHVFHHDQKIYLMLFEANRQIRQIQEFTDHIRITTLFNNGGGTFNKNNEINTVLYIQVIDEIDKPFTVIREEELNTK